MQIFLYELGKMMCQDFELPQFSSRYSQEQINNCRLTCNDMQSRSVAGEIKFEA